MSSGINRILNKLNAPVEAFEGIDHRWRRAKKVILSRKPWVCGICEKLIETREEMSIDHIIPKSKGGSSRLSNIQLAHKICNSIKGNKYDASRS